jgi:hypothetical protein
VAEAGSYADDEGSPDSQSSSDSDGEFDADAFFALPQEPSTGGRGSNGGSRQRAQHASGASRRAAPGSHSPSQAGSSYQPGRVRIPVLLTPLDGLARQGGVRMVPAPSTGPVLASVAVATAPPLHASHRSPHPWGLGPGELSLLYKKNGCTTPLAAPPAAATSAASAPAAGNSAGAVSAEGSGAAAATGSVPVGSEATSNTVTGSTPAIPDLVISSRSRRIARGVSLSDPLLRERNKYSVQEVRRMSKPGSQLAVVYCC